MQDHLVALRVAVHVVVGLERIQVEIRDDEAFAVLDQAVDTAAQRGVARQQRQRIGMLGRLQLLLGDQPQHVDGLAEAVIAAVLGDHELLGQARPTLLGHEPTHLFQAQLAVHEQRRRLHDRGHRLLVVDLRMQRLREQVEQLLAANDAERPTFLNDGQSQMIGMIAEQVRELLHAHVGRDRANVSGDVLGAQRGVRDDRAVERFELLQRCHRRDVGPPEQIALQAVDAEIDQLAALALGLDAFGDHAAAHRAAHVEHRAHELPLGLVGVDAADEVAVDLHVVRLELGPGAQARGAGAEIVDGDRATGFAQPLQRRAQPRVVIEQAFFGQLDDAAVGRHVRLSGVVEEARGEARLFVDGVRRDVDEQQPGDARGRKTLERALDAQEIELQLHAALARRLEQVLRRVQPAVGRAAGQCLEAADAAGARVDDRLKQGRDAPFAHELGELVRRGVEPAQTQGRRVWADFGHAPGLPVCGW